MPLLVQDTMLTQPSKMEFKDQFHSQQTPIRIIHVGAGAAGLLTAFKAQKCLRNFELVCYEKNSHVGGTWYENRYPGCGCDVPAHSYTFSFEPNPEWSSFYVPAEEIRAYFENFSKKYALDRFVCLDTTVIGADWDDIAGEWAVDLQRKDGSQFTDRCNVIINGSGPLNKWKWPDIPGRETFKGTVCHTSAWDPKIDWTGKKVAVIGAGASGVQVTPQLAKTAGSLTLFARSVQWITPPLGYQEIRVPGVDDAEVPELTASGGGRHTYTSAEKKALRDDPNAFLQYRKTVDQILQRWFNIFKRDTPERGFAVQEMTKAIRARFGDQHAELANYFVPEFSPGCRRNTPGEGFIEALIQDNVTVVKDEIASFTEGGLVTVDGREMPFDLIVCATGFDVAYSPHFRVTGLHGKTMKEAWSKTPRVYLTMATPDFPNFFNIGGPTGNWGSGCVLVSHEVQAEYAIQACVKISEEQLHSLVPKDGPTNQYMAFSAAWHRRYSVWAEGCRSWYKNGGRLDGEVMLWCGSMLHMMKTLKTPRWEDYEIRFRDDKNMWAFLGGLGQTELETKAQKGIDVDLSPFVRKNDEMPWTIL